MHEDNDVVAIKNGPDQSTLTVVTEEKHVFLSTNDTAMAGIGDNHPYFLCNLNALFFIHL